MKASQPPRLATWLLTRLGAGTLDVESLQGDLIEQYRLGFSRWWYWRQVLIGIVVGSVQAIGARKLLAVRAVATGWVVLVLVFGVLGDLVAEALAKQVWNWTREVGYGSQTWWPFQLSAAFVSYSGFAFSAWAVARLHRNHTVPMLLAYLASVSTALVASAAIISWLGAGVPVPHSLFYLVSVTLPYQWRSGFVLVPVIILLSGLCGSRRPKAAPSLPVLS